MKMRKRFSRIGWALVGMELTMNVFVLLGALPDMFGILVWQGMEQFPYQQMIDAINNGSSGYYAVVILGIGILLTAEGPRFWREELWERREPMKVGTFFAIASVFLGLQLAASIITDTINVIANLFHRDILQIYEEMVLADQDNFSRFFYASILAPIWEELLFRGWIQRKLRPFGKVFAITAVSLLFSLTHGNLAQIPFAFLAGLVLSYTAEHYSLGWCMVLHMVNNLVIADLIPRLTAYLPEMLDYGIQNGLLLICSIAGVIVLWRSRKKLWQEFSVPADSGAVKAFFFNTGILTFLALMLKTCWDAMYWV